MSEGRGVGLKPGAVELITSPSLLSPHITDLTAFEADPVVIIGFAACEMCNHGKLYIEAYGSQLCYSSEPLPLPSPLTKWVCVHTSASGCTTSWRVVKEGETSADFKVTL